MLFANAFADRVLATFDPKSTSILNTKDALILPGGLFAQA
jgi:hypothetical protein